MLKISVNNVKDTIDIGVIVGECLPHGSILCLSGDLGAGKTVLTGGIAKGLGLDCYITSPTFTLVNEYQTSQGAFYHFDVYRMTDEEEMYDIGFDEYLSEESIVVIEWFENIKNLIPSDHIEIFLKRNPLADDEGRIILMDCKGDVSQHTVHLITERLQKENFKYESSCN